MTATTEAWADVYLEDIEIDGAKLSADVVDICTSAQLSRQMDASSTITLTLADPTRLLSTSPLLVQEASINVNDHWFTLASVEKQGDSYNLIFEDWISHELKKVEHSGFRKATRGQFTRAEFVAMLVREVPGIIFFCPEIHKDIPVAKTGAYVAYKKSERKRKKRERRKGLSPTASLTVKGNPANQAQRDVGEQILEVGVKKGATDLVVLAALEAAITESSMTNLSGGDRDSAGIFQMRPSQGWGTFEQVTDPDYSINLFYDKAISYAARHSDASAGQIAQGVEVSAYPYRYSQWESEAKKWVAAFHGDGTGGTAGSVQKIINQKYEFARGFPGKPETTWDCITRLAQEVNWHVFSISNTLYFVSDETLMASVPRHTLSENLPYVDGIDYDWDTGHRAASATVTIEAGRWWGPPGSVCELSQCGPADGRWIIQAINRALTDSVVTVTLRRYSRPQLEPKPNTTTQTTPLSQVSGQAILDPGADRAGVKTNPWVIAFVARVAGECGFPIHITTGTNHSRLTSSVNPATHQYNVSDHWEGNAADLGSVANGFPIASPTTDSPKGDKICEAALIVGGENPAAAKRIAQQGMADMAAGVIFDSYKDQYGNSFRVQVLWKTFVGGDHYNHVHIGVKPNGPIKGQGYNVNPGVATPDDNVESDPYDQMGPPADEVAVATGVSKLPGSSPDQVLHP